MRGLMGYLFGEVSDEAMFDESSADTFLAESASDSDDLALAAVNRGNRTRFVEQLAARGVWLVVRLDAAQFEGDVHLLEYEENDRRVLPLFSSLYEAWAFVHTIDISQMVPMQYLHVNALFLTHNDLSSFKIVLNPFAGATTEIQEPDLQSLRVVISDMIADQMESM